MAQQPTTQTTAPATQQTGAVGKPRQGGMAAIKEMFKNENIMAQFQNALKANASTFIAAVIELCSTDANLQKCDPAQLAQEALKAAVLHLPINKALGQAYIIPFNNTKRDANGRPYKVYEPTFQIGYKGLYQLAMRTNEYAIINADVVYEGEFRSKSKLTGEIDVEGTRTSDKIVGYFAYFQLKGGYHKGLYMTVEEMAAHAKQFSKALGKTPIETLLEMAKLPVNNDSKTVGWLGNFHAMAIKTVLRILLGKFGYLSVTLHKAIATDESSDTTETKPTATMAAVQVETRVDIDTVDYEDVSDANANVDNTDNGELETDVDCGF